MSSPYKPRGRRTGMIGCMIRNGVTPGGFSSVLSGSKRVPKKRAISAVVVKEAAIEALARHGIDRQQPDLTFDITATKIPAEFR